jgi:hypothetical protein
MMPVACYIRGVNMISRFVALNLLGVPRVR